MKVFDAVHDFNYSWDEVSTANWRKYSPWNKQSSHVIAVDTLSRSIDRESGSLRTERLLTCRQATPKWLNSFIGGSEVSYVYEVSYVTPPKPASPITNTTSQPPSSTSNPSTPSKIAIAPNLPPSSHSSSSQTTSNPATPVATSLQQTFLPPTPAPILKDPPGVPTISMTSVNLTWSDLLRVHERVTYTPCPLDPTHKTRFEQHASITATCGGWAKVREKIEGFTVERFGQNAAKGREGFESVLKMGREVGFATDTAAAAAT